MAKNHTLTGQMKGLASQNTLGWLLVGMLAIAWVLPFIFSHGMFYDGLIYATVSRNMAEGIGSTWKPQLNETSDAVFYGHLPLVFSIQSAFFRLVGDFYFTEKLYSCLCFLITGGLIAALWGIHQRGYYWLPLLCWLSFQAVKWSYINNFQENTIGIFCLLAAWVYIRAFTQGKRYYLAAIVAGFITVLAILCKSPLAMFPFSIPIWHWLVFRAFTFSRALFITLLSCAVLALTFAVLWQIPVAQEGFIRFVDIQLKPAIDGDSGWVRDSRLYAIAHLFLQSAPLLGACLLLYMPLRKSVSLSGEATKLVVFYTLVGLSGTLPIMVSLKQMDVYMIPAIPFFALGGATFAKPFVQHLQGLLKWPRVIALFNVALLATIIVLVGWSVSRHNVLGRDKQLQAALHELEPHLPTRTVLRMSDEWHATTVVKAYLARFYRIEVDVWDEQAQYYLLTPDETLEPSPPYSVVASTSQGYRLYAKR